MVTLTGRTRGRLPFSQARGAEYLDLADDAAKSALYSVVAAGYRVVAHTEDTILVELPDLDETAGQAEEVQRLAREGAEAVLAGIAANCTTEMLFRW